MSHSFEDDVLETLANELRPVGVGEHLSDAEIGSLLRARCGGAKHESLRLHLLTCASCRTRYDTQGALESSVLATVSPSGLGLAEPRGRGLWSRPEGLSRAARRMGRGMVRYSGVAALVMATVAVLLLAFHVAQRRPSPALTAAPSASMARGAGTVAPTDGGADLTPQALVAELIRYEGYPAHRAAAYTIGLLNRYGVPIATAGLAFSAADAHTVRPGETWESVARDLLGDSRLWPILILLNLELTQEGEFVPPGTVLRIPQVSEGVR